MLYIYIYTYVFLQSFLALLGVTLVQFFTISISFPYLFSATSFALFSLNTSAHVEYTRVRYWVLTLTRVTTHFIYLLLLLLICLLLLLCTRWIAQSIKSEKRLHWSYYYYNLLHTRVYKYINSIICIVYKYIYVHIIIAIVVNFLCCS